jgi:hypothetical protein
MASLHILLIMHGVIKSSSFRSFSYPILYLMKNISRKHKIFIWLRILEVPPSRTNPIEAPKSKLICLPKIDKTLLLQHDSLASRFLEKNIKIN